MSIRISKITQSGTVAGTDWIIVTQPSATEVYTAATISALASDNSLNDEAEQFVAEGFAANEVIRIEGFTGTVGNNFFSARILSATAGKLVLADDTVLVDDAAGESVTITRWLTRIAQVEDVTAGAVVDASTVTYAPVDNTDWTGSADPGNVDDALDQLAARMIVVEGATSGAVELRGLTFTSDTGSTADSDPGAGLFKWNNATQASATYLYLDETTLDSINLDTFFASLGSSGFIYLQQSDDFTKWQLWKWTGVAVDGTGYWKIPVTLQASGGSIADAKTVFCDFSSAGGSGGSEGKHAIPVMAVSITPRVSGGPATIAYTAGASGKPDIAYLAFDSASAEYAQFTIAMPKSWDEGTVTFIPHWKHPATATNFGVTWKLRALAVSNDDTLVASYGTAQTSTDTGGTTDDLYSGPESSAITIAGTPAAQDLVFFEIYRDPADGSDTMAVDAHLIGLTIYITTDASTDA